MPTIRIAIVCSDVASADLYAQLRRNPRVRLLPAASNAWALTKVIAAELNDEEAPASLPIAAILPWHADRPVEPWCRRLVMEFPELTVYSLRGDRATRYRGVVHAHAISRGEMLADVLGSPPDGTVMPIVRFESPELDR
jgi:hypothetical protein